MGKNASLILFIALISAHPLGIGQILTILVDIDQQDMGIAVI